MKSYDYLHSRVLPLFNFERLDILCALIGHPSEKLWPFEFIESFRCSISSIWYIMRLNRKSEWKIMTIWISRELPLFNFERLDILCAGIVLPSEMLWPFEFLESFRCSISSVLIYYALLSDIRVKSYDHLNSRELPLFNFERLDILCPWIGHPCYKLWPLEFSRASVVQFRASRYIMLFNRTSEWKVITI